MQSQFCLITQHLINYIVSADLDECQHDYTCPENSVCVNDAPGYHCECIQGFESQEDGTCTSNTSQIQQIHKIIYKLPQI